MIEKICIIGVGLIGGSFAAGLKKSCQIQSIVGFDKDESNLQKAQTLGVIDEFSLDIATALNGVQLVLIATPVDSFKEILTLIKPHIDASVIVSDVSSTKGSVLQAARDVFGEVPARFIPAHPIAGKEKSGVAAADAQLFNGKCVILTPSQNADACSVAEVSDLWRTLGARVEVMNHEQHDYLLAMTSHLPHMLAFSLMDYLVNKNQDVYGYTAGGFKDFSRIASSNAIMWRDICLHNAEQIVHHIEGYQQHLTQLSNLIKNKQSAELEKLFVNVKSARDKMYS